MTPPEIDLRQPDAVRCELLDDDRAVKDDFARHLDGELNGLAEVLPPAFACCQRSTRRPTGFRRNALRSSPAPRSVCWTTS
jgi:hypothetical protein